MITNEMKRAKRDINDRDSEVTKPCIPIGIIPLGCLIRILFKSQII